MRLSWPLELYRAVSVARPMTFEVGKLPISTRIKVYREFDVQNRMEGTAGFFTVSLPLGLDSSVKPMSAAIKAKL